MSYDAATSDTSRGVDRPRVTGPSPARHRWWRRPPGIGSATAIAVVTTLVALGLVARGAEWGRVAAVDSPRAWILLAAAAWLQLLTLPLKAFAWRTALRAVHPAALVRVRSLVPPVAVAALFNMALVGRLGDATRILLVHARLRRDGTPAAMSAVVGSTITETLASLTAWTLLVIGVGVFLPLSPVVWILIAGTTVAVTCLCLAAWRGWGRDARGAAWTPMRRLAALGRRVWIAVADGQRALARTSALAPLASASLAGWAAQWASVFAVLTAFEVARPAQAATLVLVSTSVAQTFPLIPGNIGVFQAAVALPLLSYGISPSEGIAIGVMLQLVQGAPIAIAGALAMATEGPAAAQDLVRAARRIRHGGAG